MDTPESIRELEADTKNPIKRLLCCCCGDTVTGRQWGKRDIGQGICSKCANREADRETPNSMIELYGLEGIHYAPLRAIGETVVKDPDDVLYWLGLIDTALLAGALAHGDPVPEELAGKVGCTYEDREGIRWALLNWI